MNEPNETTIATGIGELTGVLVAARIESNTTMRYVWRKTPGELPIRVLQECVAVREGAKFWTEWRDVPTVEE